ncbi:MAG TPA: AMP-binding protein, partial [Candidatus Dormibacteraeota bacterium]|nr:AMP-binding protein [Candidatus Dormibacteraeota bacterium]
METPLTPLEFARRTRKLYGDREGVVDGGLRMTYSQFFDRCDRWSSALQAMGVAQGDRVAYIAPNTHEQLESFYAVPQIGAVLVPINYRLTAEDFVYITSHSGSKVLCVHPDYVAAVDGVRDQLKTVEQFVVLGRDADGRQGWLECDDEISRARPAFKPVEIAETDLLALNYTSGTTAKPKGVMITHRNAWINVMDTLVHFHLTVDDTYLWTLPMFHANG